MRREPLPANPANAQGGAAPTSGCFSAREKRKRIFKACGGLFVRCGEKCEGGGSARFELLSPALPTSARMSPHQVIPRRWLHPCSARLRFTWFRCSAYPLSGSVLRTPQNSGQEEVWANSRSRSDAFLEWGAEHAPNNSRDARCAPLRPDA